MSVTSDLSDEGLVRRFGDIMHEMPELFEAIRRFEIENRSTSAPGGFAIKSDWVSVQRSEDMTRLRVRNARR
jgi:hypothetical protein